MRTAFEEVCPIERSGPIRDILPDHATQACTIEKDPEGLITDVFWPGEEN